MTVSEYILWLATILAVVVSFLTLYNAAKLRTGILAVATYAFGGGMLCLSAAFFLLAMPNLEGMELTEAAWRVMLLVSFLFLGFGSFKIYSMSRI